MASRCGSSFGRSATITASTFDTAKPCVAATATAWGQHGQAGGAFPLRVRVREVPADVALRLAPRIASVTRVRQHVRVRVADGSLVQGNSRRPGSRGRPSTRRWKSYPVPRRTADAVWDSPDRAWRDRPVGHGGNLQVRSLSGHDPHGEAGGFGQRRLIGRRRHPPPATMAAASTAARNACGVWARNTRSRGMVRSTGTAGRGRASGAQLDGVARGQRRQRSPGLPRPPQWCGRSGRRHERTGRVVDDDETTSSRMDAAKPFATESWRRAPPSATEPAGRGRPGCAGGFDARSGGSTTTMRSMRGWLANSSTNRCRIGVPPNREELLRHARAEALSSPAGRDDHAYSHLTTPISMSRGPRPSGPRRSDVESSTRDAADAPTEAGANTTTSTRLASGPPPSSAPNRPRDCRTGPDRSATTSRPDRCTTSFRMPA